MTTPALDAAIRQGCEEADRHDACVYPRCLHNLCLADCKVHDNLVKAALRSLATPAPEVIEAMGKAAFLVHYAGPQVIKWEDRSEAQKDIFRDEARAAHAAEWTRILGGTK